MIRIAHYKMLKHEKRVKNPQRKQLLKKAKKRFAIDGLNSLNYTLKGIKKYKMFTHILIDVGEPPVELLKAIEELVNQSINKNGQQQPGTTTTTTTTTTTSKSISTTIEKRTITTTSSTTKTSSTSTNMQKAALSTTKSSSKSIHKENK